MDIRELNIDYYQDILQLWQSDPNIDLSSADERSAILRFLERNPGTSFVLIDNTNVVGTVLGGFDGRRGYIYHLFVHPDYRRNGHARALLERVEKAYMALGIEKSLVCIFKDNKEADFFWKQMGYDQRGELEIYSKELS